LLTSSVDDKAFAWSGGQSSRCTGWCGAFCCCRQNPIARRVLVNRIACFEMLDNERRVESGNVGGCFGIAFSESAEIWNGLCVGVE
jgi:hypothetical protein